MLTFVARQFGNPRGVLGWLVGRGMARSNADFSRWTVLQIEQHLKQSPRRIVEIGPGPGIGLEELLRRFPEAQVCGVDRAALSPLGRGAVPGRARRGGGCYC